MKVFAAQLSALGLDSLPPAPTSWPVLSSFSDFQAFCNIGQQGPPHKVLEGLNERIDIKSLPQNVTQENVLSADCCPCIRALLPSPWSSEASSTVPDRDNRCTWTERKSCCMPHHVIAWVPISPIPVSLSVKDFSLKYISIFKRKTSSKMSRFS